MCVLQASRGSAPRSPLPFALHIHRYTYQKKKNTHTHTAQALRAEADREREQELAALEATKAARLEATKAAHALELADVKTRCNARVEAQRERLEGLKSEVMELRRRVRQDEQRRAALQEQKESREGHLPQAA
jgi:hypothetical protein